VPLDDHPARVADVGDLLSLASDVDDTLLEVDVPALEAQQLAASKRGEGCEVHKGPQPRFDGVAQVENSGGVDEGPLGRPLDPGTLTRHGF